MTDVPQKSVLLDDEDRFVMDLYIRAFKEKGFLTDSAFGAAEALKKMRSGQFDFVLLDVNMMAVSGLELLEKVRAEKLLPKATFIMLTNDTNPDKIKKATELGAKDYLIKSNTPPEWAAKKVLELSLQTPNV